MRVKMKNKKKAVKLAPKDYVNTLIWFLGGFWVEIMLDGNFTYNLGADTCRAVFQKFLIYHHFWAILGHFGPFWDR